MTRATLFDPVQRTQNICSTHSNIYLFIISFKIIK